MSDFAWPASIVESLLLRDLRRRGAVDPDLQARGVNPWRRPGVNP
jgi:hypothetical protein